METVVLKHEDAIEWLKKEARNFITDFEDTMYDASNVADIIKDLLENVELIRKKNWEWVAIEECPMAVSDIQVVEMVRG